MKSFNIVALLCLFVILFSCKENDSITSVINSKPSASQLTLANSSNITGFNIFKKINEDEDNYLISPLSINIALSMAYNGADGATKEEIRNVLNLNSTEVGNFNDDYSKLIQLLINSDSKVKMSSANSIWNIPSLIVESEYRNILNNYFNAESFTRDFTNPNTLTELNNWVKDKTNGKIEKILDNIDANSVLFLVNAIYFKADWQKAYLIKVKLQKESFKNYSGSVSQVDMMNMSDSLISSYTDEQISAIDLKYGQGNYSMTILLPNESISVKDYLNQLDIEKYNSIIKQMSSKPGSNSIT